MGDEQCEIIALAVHFFFLFYMCVLKVEIQIRGVRVWTGVHVTVSSVCGFISCRVFFFFLPSAAPELSATTQLPLTHALLREEKKTG